MHYVQVCSFLLILDSIFDQLIESNGYPFLNNKKEYVHNKTVMELMEQDSETLEIGRRYTILELQQILKRIAVVDSKDSGLAIVNNEFLAGENLVVLINVGYIAYTELEHAVEIAKERDNEAYPCFFRRLHQGTDERRTPRTSETWNPRGLESFESVYGVESREPNDFTKWMDQSPTMVSGNTSMELVFMRLG